MIKRYSNDQITEIWSNESKLRLWQKVELAVIKALCSLDIFPEWVYGKIEEILLAHSIDITWWLNREKETRHDLNAFIDERVRFLPTKWHRYFHKGMTSYDTEEPAMALMLLS